MIDTHKQLRIGFAAENLASDARSLCALIGAGDPNEYTGWRNQIARAKADIAEIERRAAHHANEKESDNGRS